MRSDKDARRRRLESWLGLCVVLACPIVASLVVEFTVGWAWRWSVAVVFLATLAPLGAWYAWILARAADTTGETAAVRVTPAGALECGAYVSIDGRAYRVVHVEPEGWAVVRAAPEVERWRR